MEIQKDRVVLMDYKLTNNDGAVLDSSEGREPLAYLHGHQNIIPGLENALAGKVAGDSLTVTVPCAEGYGEIQESMIQTASRSQFPPEVDLQIGMQFQAQIQGHPVVFKVEKIEGDQITINGNHELAGVDLTFDVTIREVREATEKDLKHGHVHSGECCGGCGSHEESEDCCDDSHSGSCGCG